MERRPGLGLRPILFGLLLSFVFYLLVAGGVLAASALADEPIPYVPPADWVTQPELPELASCPSAEVPLIAEEEAEGEVEPVSPELRELGHLRLEQQQVCRAQTDRLDQVLERLWWVTDEASSINHRSAVTNEKLVVVNELLEDIFNTQCGVPCLVRVQGQEVPFQVEGAAGGNRVLVEGEGTEGAEGSELSEVQTAELITSIDAAGEAEQLGLWFIAGLVVASVLGYGLYRVVDRNT